MKRTFWILILSACVANSALAQRGGGGRGGGDFGGGPPQGMFAMIPIQAALDTDKDGKISAAEIKNATAALQKLDLNKDGSLTDDELRPEFGRGREGRGPGEGERGGRGGAERGGERGGQRGGPQGGGGNQVARLMEYDKDKDGQLSKDELPAQLQSLMARVDSNKDGVASREELTAAMPAGAEGRGRFGGPGERGERGERGPGQHGPGEHGNHEHGEPGMQGPGARPRANPQAMLTRAFEFDADKDGMLSRAELEKMFAAGPPEGGPQHGGQERGGRGGAERGGAERGRQSRRPAAVDQ